MNLVFAIFFIPLVLGKHACPGGTYQCDDSATCCQLLDKSYGCCPMKDAVCCDDHIHCCPVNTKCATGMCIQQELSGPRNSSGFLIKANNVTCPGGQFTCPDDTTCCDGRVPGTYGCCPLEDAVCCSDKVHCCPSGTTCNVEEGTCNGDGFISQMYGSKKRLFKSHVPEFQQIVQIESSEVSSVICPGSAFQCPNGYTCCKLQSGQWGCCPFPMATCCKDGLHCCPHNMQCDATSSHCSQGPNNITSARSVPAVAVTSEKILCPDKSECQDTMTCCALSDVRYGCCQYQNATCCSDKLHCCPSGNRCDVKHKRCVPENNWLLNAVL